MPYINLDKIIFHMILIYQKSECGIITIYWVCF